MRYYLVVLIAIFVTACGPQLTPVLAATQTSLPTNIIATLASSDNRQERMVALAIDDLASRFALNRQKISVIFVQPARWPDAALGCPHPVETSAEQVEPGYLIVLEAKEQIYEYRADTGNTVILCDSVVEESKPAKKIDQNVVDGWPNKTKDGDAIITTPVK